MQVSTNVVIAIVLTCALAVWGLFSFIQQTVHMNEASSFTVAAPTKPFTCPDCMCFSRPCFCPVQRSPSCSSTTSPSLSSAPSSSSFSVKSVSCPSTAVCFLGQCFCKAGYKGVGCDQKMQPPRQLKGKACMTYKDEYENISITEFPIIEDRWCYYQPESVICQIPKVFWESESQTKETKVWVRAAHDDPDALMSDRTPEHYEGFGNYVDLPLELGNVIEFGAGPWTQIRGIIDLRPQTVIESITLIEPNAKNYMENVAWCSYGKLHDYKLAGLPTYIISEPGEVQQFKEEFDTAISINVIEHVHDAFAYLHNIWASLKVGGLLIFEDRYHPSVDWNDEMLGEWALHPIRIGFSVLDHFRNQFDMLYLNVKPTARMQQNHELGFYIIGRKKAVTSECMA
eukprot:TRINITY_DN2624_c0_g1_i1.p1 TRINITY_DN2624_c0_g1~~TRINITY_DN2624_c0_g1_i1.p1  ORF type:complete len:399 (-),score=54.92 TRINITY_DN2624_c0_g1_i1:404-1600(-)